MFKGLLGNMGKFEETIEQCFKKTHTELRTEDHDQRGSLIWVSIVCLSMLVRHFGPLWVYEKVSFPGLKFTHLRPVDLLILIH